MEFWSRCIPPIRWLQKTFVPPVGDEWGPRIAYQPMLYLGCFLAALTILIFGDFTNVPSHPGIDADRQYGLFWIWGSLSLICPVLALGSLWLIQHRRGLTRYRGLWLRLAADIGQCTAMVMYVILRLTWGDYHVYPVAVLMSATLFVFHLIIRDLRQLRQVEHLASRLHRNSHDAR